MNITKIYTKTSGGYYGLEIDYMEVYMMSYSKIAEIYHSLKDIFPINIPIDKDKGISKEFTKGDIPHQYLREIPQGQIKYLCDYVMKSKE